MTAEQFAITRVVLPFQRWIIPRRLARGEFMLIYVDRLNREHHDQHDTIPQLIAARDALPRRCRYGNGRWDTKFAVVDPTDVFIAEQDRMCAWDSDTPAKLEQAASQRRQSERSDLGRHGAVKAAHKKGPAAFEALAERPTVQQEQPQTVRGIRKERGLMALGDRLFAETEGDRRRAAKWQGVKTQTAAGADRVGMERHGPKIIAGGGLVMWLQTVAIGGSLFVHATTLAIMFGGAWLTRLTRRKPQR